MTERLLLVEDDESLGAVLVDALEREGYRPCWVREGRAALESALRDPYDLVVLDLMLPGMDGYEICRRLRAAGRDVPILMLTARAREEDRVMGLDLGADDYVVKPFSL
jgi:DNA-binding response OmpR family regulator